MTRSVLMSVGVILAACSGAAPLQDGSPAKDSSPFADLPLRRDTTVDAGRDLPRDVDRQEGPLLERRGVFHVHSVYSHDACDGNGLVSGKPDAACLGALRAALCARGLEFAALTDHPSHMSSHTFEQDLLHDAAAGDQLVLGNTGSPIANRLACGNGRFVLVSVGFEATHMMPIGLREVPKDQSLYAGTSDKTDLAAVISQVTALKQAGAVVAMAHSEESDISAQRILDAGFDAMEWYNPHGNFKTLLGGGGDKLTLDLTNLGAAAALVGKLITLADFLAGGPHPDLVYLLLLDSLPQEGFTKWRVVQRTRPVTGILGSDVHQNVSLEVPLCNQPLGQVACSVALDLLQKSVSFTIPAAIKALILSGGKIVLSDGDRFDSYGRVLRWLENRVLVRNDSVDELFGAVRAGRVYGVFAVFGDPAGFAVTASVGNKTAAIGDEIQRPATLRITPPPSGPVARDGAPFSSAQAAQAEVRVKVWRTDAVQSVVFHEAVATQASIELPLSLPGAYHVELWIRPRHLTTALGSQKALGDKEYLWVITNPIRVAQ